MAGTDTMLVKAITWRWPTARFDVRRGTVERWRHPQPRPTDAEIERAVFDYSVRSLAHAVSEDVSAGLLQLNLAVQTAFVVKLVRDVQRLELVNPQPHSQETLVTIAFVGTGIARSVAWGKRVVWSNGLAPTLSASGTDVVQLLTLTSGDTWYGRVFGANYR